MSGTAQALVALFVLGMALLGGGSWQLFEIAMGEAIDGDGTAPWAVRAFWTGLALALLALAGLAFLSVLWALRGFA